MNKTRIITWLFALSGLTLTSTAQTSELKPRLVVCTDIAPADVEPDDMESMVHLMVYADMFEIEALITSVGWNCDPYPKEWAQYLHRVIDAYAQDVKNLMKRSNQQKFLSLDKENGSQRIGYWPSAEYIRSRAVMGSERGGIKVIGEGNDSPGSELLIRLADEDDPRPIYVAAWGGANTLAQAIWRVKQTRTADELKKFVRKFRIYTITDQDMQYSMRMNRAYSSHQWLRSEFPEDLQFIWDEGTWQEQCELGKQSWKTIQKDIQGKGALGKEYPNYKWGVEGDTPSFLYVLPNGLNNPEDPSQAGWAGYHERGMCPDSLTTAWTSWQEPVRSISVGYKKQFYAVELMDFAARMQWADKGEGNRNPILTVNGHQGPSPLSLHAKAGERICLDASKTTDPDGNTLHFHWWQQNEIGTAKLAIDDAEKAVVNVSIPDEAAGQTLHLVCEVGDNGHHNLRAYQRVIIHCDESREQETKGTHLTYDLSTEASVGSGDYTAYQLVTNRHHALATRPNTAYLRGAIYLDHALSKDFTLNGAVDVIASIHADHQLYLQQCYANLDYQKTFFLEVGSREEKPVVRDALLSSGSFVKGTNAKPIPQIHVGTNDFWTLPYTKDWLQVNFDFGYGKPMDSSYREDKYKEATDVNLMYTTGAYYHQKHLYFRTNPTKRLFVTAGIQHVAQFGGTNYNKEDDATKEKPANLKAMWNVVLPLGDSNYYEDEALEDWIYGNHLGLMTLQLGWNINGQHQVQAYYDDIFEDGSGMRKSNGWDGLWGLQFTNNASGRQYIRGIVAEFFQTTNQSGPLHWDGGDFPEPIRSQITDAVFGDDNYYNHMFYDSYAHYGMTPGNALITSPIYNKDGYTRYRDNRIKAWHLGLNGEITDRLSYVVKGSYREGWGTYQIPLAVKHHSFDAMVQGLYDLGPWQFGAAYAFDKGNIYGDCSTFNIKIGYHGKIL